MVAIIVPSPYFSSYFWANATINAKKDFMGVMMLAASKGTSIIIEIQGDDEESAANALTALIVDRFGELE